MDDFERIAMITRDIYGRGEMWRELQSRATARKLVPGHICRAIGLSPSAWNGWKMGKMLPTWRSLELLKAEIDRQCANVLTNESRKDN